MDALAAYGDMNNGGEGGPPRFDIGEAPLNGVGVPIGPYMDKRFLGTCYDHVQLWDLSSYSGCIAAL